MEISDEDNDLIVRGRIEILVLQQRFWILVIESKKTEFDVTAALPQALVYMLKNSQNYRPTFAFLLNGREFVFVKLQKADVPIYSRSYALSIDRGNDWEQVLAALKNIGNISYQLTVNS